MKITESVGYFLAGKKIEAERAAFEKRIAEAVQGAYGRGHDDARATKIQEAVGPDDMLFGRHFYNTPLRAGKDYDVDQHRKIVQRSNAFYNEKGLAHRCVEIVLDYAIGKGFTYDVAEVDAALLKVISDLWDGERNALRQRQRKMMLAHLLDGETCRQAWMNPVNGAVTYGYVDPYAIESVMPDPHNARNMKWVIVETGMKRVALRVIRKFSLAEYTDPEIKVDDAVRAAAVAKATPYDGLLAGAIDIPMERAILADDIMFWNQRGEMKSVIVPELDPNNTGQAACVYVGWGATEGARRGKPFLTHALDDIALYSQAQINSVHRTTALLSHLWDVTIKNQPNQAAMQAVADGLGFNSVRPGRVVFHNENVEIKSEAPGLAAGDIVAILTALKQDILGELGIPEYMYGSGSNTNLATADAQSDPTLKTLEASQNEMREVFDFLTQYQVDAKTAAGQLPRAEKNYRDKFEIISGAIAKASDATLTATMNSLALAMSTAQERGWMTPEESRDAWQAALVKGGIVLADKQADNPDEAPVVPERPPVPPANPAFKAFKESAGRYAKR